MEESDPQANTFDRAPGMGAIVAWNTPFVAGLSKPAVLRVLGKESTVCEEGGGGGCIAALAGELMGDAVGWGGSETGEGSVAEQDAVCA